MMGTPRRRASFYALFLCALPAVRAFLLGNDRPPPKCRNHRLGTRAATPATPAFVAPKQQRGGAARRPARYSYAAAVVLLRSSPDPEPSAPSLPGIDSMKIGEIRAELESYGIPTKSFLEKKELVAELGRARKAGMRTVAKNQNQNDSSPSSAASSASASRKPSAGASPSGTRASSPPSPSRDDRIKEEMRKAASMSVSDLKKELARMGVPTKTFFEKSEFVRAYAEAAADGVNGNRPPAGSGSGSGSADGSEPYDPEYRDVIMQKMGRSDPRLLQGTVIDVPIKKR